MFVLSKEDGTVAEARYMGLSNGAEEYIIEKKLFDGDTGVLRIECPELCAKVGEDGYFVIPPNPNTPGAYLVRFSEREDLFTELKDPTLNCQCYILKDMSAVVIYERSYNYGVYVSVKGGVYTQGIRIDLCQQPTHEDIRLFLLRLPCGADYNACAKAIREYKLRSGEITSLRDKCAERAELEYARKHPMIRLRMGWKPVPPTVLEQTEENEPPMHVAASFKDVRDLADRMKAAGVDGAEITLVGWNIGGHDGRWPQILPADERLGGNVELVKTIEHLKSIGYGISCHTNTIDSYTIARNYREDRLAIKRDGSVRLGGTWGGGQSRYVCPLKQLDYARETLPEVAALGFRGLHYIDVLSVVIIPTCLSKEHPATAGEGGRAYGEIMKLSRELFGGFASEGGYDHCMGGLDYSLYNSFYDYILPARAPFEFADEVIPMWELTYHGITLYNPCTLTVNYPIKCREAEITYRLYGGRPSFYIYSKFLTEGTNWMGNEDLRIDSEEELSATVDAIKKAADEYKELCDLQLEYMESYRITKNGLKVIRYENGTEAIANYTDVDLEYGGEIIPALSGVIRRQK